jgi:hypothetical protein
MSNVTQAAAVSKGNYGPGKVYPPHPVSTELAEAFCELSDVQQADFFREVARVASEWPETHGVSPEAVSLQWSHVGRVLSRVGYEAGLAVVQEIASMGAHVAAGLAAVSQPAPAGGFVLDGPEVGEEAA